MIRLSRNIFFQLRKHLPMLLLTGFFWFFAAARQEAKASPTVALDLTYKWMGGSEYEFTLTLYKDCKATDLPAQPLLHIQSASCYLQDNIALAQNGTATEVSPVCAAQLSNTSCNGGTLPGILKYIYKGTYILPTNCPDWVFSYTECCRNTLVSNLAEKKDIYIEARLDNSIIPFNSSPEFTSLPVVYTCNGQSYTYNPGMVDADGDSLVYSLINPLEEAGKPALYKPGYSPAYPVKTSSGAVSFDKATGQLDMTPAGAQTSVMIIQVKEYRNGILTGTSMRDMQVIVTDCSNNRLPYLLSDGAVQNLYDGALIRPNQIEACPGTYISFNVFAGDDDGNNVSIQSNVTANIPAATVNMNASGSWAYLDFYWQPSINDLGLHVFTVTVEDDACPVPGRQSYTYSINVLSGTGTEADQAYCPGGGPVQLTASGGNTFMWTMADGSPAIGLSCNNCSNPEAAPSQTSTYVVTGNLGYTCRNTDTITIATVPGFALSVSPDTNLCSYQEGIQISAAAGPDDPSLYQYVWSPSQSLSDPAIAAPVARPAFTTRYAVEVTAPNGCRKKDSLTVEVKNIIDLSILPGDSIETCDSIDLDLRLTPTGEVFSEPFDNEIDSTNWSEINGGILSSACGAVSGSAYYLNGTGSRMLSTKPLDVHKGAVLNFYIKAGFCNQCVCDKPENDEQDENLYLDYSTDGGNTWIPLETFNADLYSPVKAFSHLTLTIPDEAQTASTRFRWHQTNHLLDKDVWILDGISIKEGLGDYTYLWTPSGLLTDPAIKNPVAFPASNTTYTIKATDKSTGCVYTDSIKVKFKKDFEVVTHPTVTHCPNDPAFQLQVTVPVGNVYTYQWYPNTGISNPTIRNPEVTPNVSTIYSVVITDPNTGCYRREEIFVSVPPAFSVTTDKDTSLCLSQRLTLSASVSPQDNYDYLWRPIAGLSDQAVPNPVARPAATTEYIVFVKNKSNGCTKSDTVKIAVYPDFKIQATDTAILCPGAAGVAIEAVAGPGTGYTYRWDKGRDITDPSSPSQFVNPSTDTTYYLLAHKTGGCWKRDSVKVKHYDGLLDLQVSNDTLINEGDHALLNAWGADKYLWRNETSAIDSVHSISVSPVIKTLYKVYGYDACYTDSAGVTVDVVPLDFFIPNLITPNGDNMNETFRITNFGKRWNVEIFNRWGKLIFAEDQYMDGWKGENEQEGVFFYHILDTKTGRTYEGWLEIVR